MNKRIWMFPLLAATSVLSVGNAAADSFEVKGVKIHYEIQGKGDPVVLIHGLYSSGGINWKLPGIFNELARTHQVIVLDVPGHGQSDKPDKKEAYGVQIVDDVALLLDHLKIKKAHIVGYSMGGMVAMKLMARHPERVLSGTVGGMGWFRAGSPLQNANVWEKLPSGKGGLPPAFLQAMPQLALSEKELRAIKVPVRVLVGDRDIIKKLYVTPLEKVRKDWTIISIPDAGHINCIFKKQFRDEIVSWVKKNSK